MKINNSTRLSYRLMTSEDADLLYELDQDVEVMKFIKAGKRTSREDIANIYIPRMQKYRNPEKGWGLWKVNIDKSNCFIGWVLVRPMDFFGEQPQWDNIELGWRFKRESWGKGYATEAANAIKKALINQSNVNKLSAIAAEDNLASIIIMKKLGMRYIKTGLHKDPLGDEQVVYYELSL